MAAIDTLTTIDPLNSLPELLAAIGWLLLEWVAQLLLLNEASLVIRAGSAVVVLLLLIVASLVVGDERVVVIVQAGVISTKGEVQDAGNDVKLAFGQLGEGQVIQLGTSEVFKAQDLPVVAPVEGLVAHQTEDLLPRLRRHPHDLVGGRLANDSNVPLKSRQSIPIRVTKKANGHGKAGMSEKNSPRGRPG